MAVRCNGHGQRGFPCHAICRTKQRTVDCRRFTFIINRDKSWQAFVSGHRNWVTQTCTDAHGTCMRTEHEINDESLILAHLAYWVQTGLASTLYLAVLCYTDEQTACHWLLMRLPTTAACWWGLGHADLSGRQATAISKTCTTSENAMYSRSGIQDNADGQSNMRHALLAPTGVPSCERTV